MKTKEDLIKSVHEIVIRSHCVGCPDASKPYNDTLEADILKAFSLYQNHIREIIDLPANPKWNVFEYKQFLRQMLDDVKEIIR